MENKITSIQEELALDKDNLDLECLDQARKFMRWSIEYAEAIRERDEAKRKAGIVRSNLNLDVRSRPQEYGVEKVTEGSVQATVDTHPDTERAEKELSDAQYAVNIFGAAKEAMSQRKDMLEKLVSLYISGYYSQPRLDSEAVGKIADSGTQIQKDALLKTRRKLADGT